MKTWARHDCQNLRQSIQFGACRTARTKNGGAPEARTKYKNDPFPETKLMPEESPLEDSFARRRTLHARCASQQRSSVTRIYQAERPQYWWLHAADAAYDKYAPILFTGE